MKFSLNKQKLEGKNLKVSKTLTNLAHEVTAEKEWNGLIDKIDYLIENDKTDKIAEEDIKELVKQFKEKENRLNQLVEELSKSCYLSKGKFPIQSLIRIPTGAYGGGGPYHSGCVESSVLAVRGIKVIFPSRVFAYSGLEPFP